MNRRSLLATLVTAGVGAGCLRSQENVSTETQVANDETANPTSLQAETATGSRVQTETQTRAVEFTQQWQFDTGSHLLSHDRRAPAVANGSLYLVGTDKKVRALSISDGTEEWMSEIEGSVRTAPTRADGTVYVGSTAGLYSLSAADGTKQWLFRPRGDPFSRPAVTGETVYFGSYDSEDEPHTTIYAVHATDGTEQWQWEFMGAKQPITPLAVSNGVIYTTTYENVLALDLDGNQKWRESRFNTSYTSPTVGDDLVYTGQKSKIFALTKNEGSTKWVADLEGVNTASRGPILVNSTLYVTGNGVTALSAEDGNVQWNTPVGGPGNLSSPTISDGFAYAGSSLGEVFIFSAEGGALRGRMRMDSNSLSAPTIVDGSLYFIDQDGIVYALSIN